MHKDVSIARKKLCEAAACDAEVFSTIDHPYTSPPIHLFDGHLRLARGFGERAVLINWDVSQPGDRFYRYEALTDTGFLAKQPLLYHYQVGVPYNEQAFNADPWKLYPAAIDAATTCLQRGKRLTSPAVQLIQGRARDVISQSSAAHASKLKPWEYTRRLLISYYQAACQPNVVRLISDQYRNYFLSPITTVWIPWCLTTIVGPMSFGAVARSAVFERQTFRHAISSSTAPIPQDVHLLAAEIAAGNVIPSLDVFLWSLAAARIKHYGNDFGFFARLAKALDDSEVASLQVTGSKDDCKRFLTFDRDYGVLVHFVDGKPVATTPKAGQAVKLTRTNSFNAVQVSLGDDMSGVLEDYAQQRFSYATFSLLGWVSYSTGAEGKSTNA